MLRRFSRQFSMLALAGVLALSGCGFHPLYGESSGASGPKLAQVRIAPIRETPDPAGALSPMARSGQMIRNNLLDRVAPRGKDGPALYELTVEVLEVQRQLGIRLDETATRGDLTLTANYRLTRIDNGERVLAAAASSIVSYDILRNEFATLSAREAARRRAAREVSESIATRVAAILSSVASERPQ
jgi:LPS-assembly lipoprotein